MNFAKSFKIYFALVTCMLFWGFTFIWYKQLYPYFSPITIVTIRLLLAVVLLYIIVIPLKKLEKVKREDYGKFFLLALFEPFIYFLGESYGVKYISSTLASLMIAIIPLIIPIASWIIFKEKLRTENYIGIVLSVIGVAFVIQSDEGLSVTHIKGILLMLLAVFSTVGFSVYVKILSEKYNSFTVVIYENLIGLILFLPLFFIFESNDFFKNLPSLNFRVFIPIINLAVFGSVTAFVLFVYSVSVLGISRTNVFANLIPVFTAILAFILLGESFNFGKITGMIIVISGVILTQVGAIVNKRKDENKPTTAR